jgi:hypothetical protein
MVVRFVSTTPLLWDISIMVIIPNLAEREGVKL